MLHAEKASPIRLSMVCFKPLPPSLLFGKNRGRVRVATSLVREMLHDSFSSKEDHASIDMALSVFPTIAIFMSRLPQSTPTTRINEDHQKTRREETQFKSIFDVEGSSLPTCVAAINYHREETHSQVLWLSTTRKAPPSDSSNVIWRKTGLATYLLCMLIKQHTGIGTGMMDHSCLSLQASIDKTEEARNFYVKLGFVSVDESDNGLSETSMGFQEVVKKAPQAWVPATAQAMTLFQLHEGRLQLPHTAIDLTLSDGGSPLVTNWHTYHYAQFPWSFKSMKNIEACLRTASLLKLLSGESLPSSDRPLLVRKSLSRLSGTIVGNRRVLLSNFKEWMSTQDILFLFAFLMRNTMSSSSLVHVLGPGITQHISVLMEECMEGVVSGDPTPEVKLCYDHNFACVRQYIDSTLDLMQHKFLVFVFNVNSSHWVSVVVVNPYLVFDTYMNDQEDSCKIDGGVGKDEISGWCVLDSLGGVSGTNGFKGTSGTPLEKPYGFRLFLNMCASILKNIKKNKGQQITSEFDYEEPFGGYNDCEGTESFPRLDFKCSSIIQQSNDYDCGLAAVANSMAFIKHLQDVNFSRASMQRLQTNGVSFLLKKQIFSLKPFWDKVLITCTPTKHDTLLNSTQLLKLMRDEYVGLLDELASLCVTDEKCYHLVLEELREQNAATHMKEAASAMTMLREGHSVGESAVVELEFSEDLQPSVATLTEKSQKQKKPALTQLRERHYAVHSPVVKPDFTEDGQPDVATRTDSEKEKEPNKAKPTEKSNKQTALTGGMKRKRTVKTVHCMPGW